ncbi:hypothetical protein F7725_027054 [Dissostichus mawsoni]|uniref:BPL/LPL catalytic domain-containing protein n=1 Tax=Dissostichus mawsoni TaxID=36200 RepID=A0A7J5XBU9_DISMA|nr:hypothetical protein F7725_027054 [Dissostichus mawsoni]
MAAQSDAPPSLVQVLRLGLLSFRESEALQQQLVLRHHQRVREENQENQENHQRVKEQSHTLLLVQHPPTFTTGLRCLPYPPPLLEGLRQTGAEVQRCSRGGLITFHGPGQLVCYPILHLGSFKKRRQRGEAIPVLLEAFRERFNVSLSDVSLTSL